MISRSISHLAAIILCAAPLGSCDKGDNKKVADAARFQKPTPTEVFNLRSKCAELGDKILEKTQGGLGSALTADVTSHYVPRTNRCYVEVNVSTADLSAPNFQTTQYLYDGQTHEILAWFKTTGPAHPEKDQCFAELAMPVDRTCRDINSKILDTMADDRLE